MEAVIVVVVVKTPNPMTDDVSTPTLNEVIYPVTNDEEGSTITYGQSPKFSWDCG